MNPWPQVKHLFEREDGSLPDIYLKNLSADEIIDIYEWLMKQCEIARNPTLWSIEKQQDIAIRDVSNPARAFVEGRVETFHHCLAELHSCDVALPELSVCVWPDSLSFDYRTGSHWTERNVIALFELLRQISLRAPKANLFQTDEGNYSNPNAEFSEAFTAYVATHSEA